VNITLSFTHSDTLRFLVNIADKMAVRLTGAQ